MIQPRSSRRDDARIRPKPRLARLDAALASVSTHLRCGLARSPKCVLLCLVRSTLYPNLLSHKSHAKGRSPVCVLLCPLSVSASLNLFPHSGQSHTNGRLDACDVRCDAREKAVGKRRPHPG